LNSLGLQDKQFYTTQDVCNLLGVKPDTFRYRIRAGVYPEVEKVGGKRRFCLEDIKQMIPG